MGDPRSGDGKVEVVVNGEAECLPEGATVRDLLDSHRAPLDRVAVEVNREIVPRADHASRRLSSGDRVEIVTFVGGG
jgi:sulfur carrier protein